MVPHKLLVPIKSSVFTFVVGETEPVVGAVPLYACV
jgi:hypothetical protein